MWNENKCPCMANKLTVVIMVNQIIAINFDESAVVLFRLSDNLQSFSSKKKNFRTVLVPLPSQSSLTTLP